MSKDSNQFKSPLLHPLYGFGPAPLNSSDSDIPYALFCKLDKIGKIADWQVPTEASTRPGGGRYLQGQQRSYDTSKSYGAGQSSHFSYYHVQEDEDTSNILSKSSFIMPGIQSTAFPSKRQFDRPNSSSMWPRSNISNRGSSVTKTRGVISTRKSRYPQFHGRDHKGSSGALRSIIDTSISAEPGWKLVEEIEFSRLHRLQYEPDESILLSEYGNLYFYDRSTMDRISTKNERLLVHHSSIDTKKQYFLNPVTASDDPILMQYADDNAGNVFATDEVLSLLMASPRAVFPWDLWIRVDHGGKIFIDRREGVHFDYLNETAAEPLEDSGKDPVNLFQALTTESAQIQINFQHQAVKENESPPISHDPCPFSSPNTTCYRYKKWNLGDGIILIARTEVHSAIQNNSNIDQLTGLSNDDHNYSLAVLRALNETDPKQRHTDWRDKLDSQKGAVLATEIRHNGHKLARWAYQAMLAGVDQIKLGFVSRVQPKDRSRHVILGVLQYQPEDFANQINLAWTNGFGILKAILDYCRKSLDAPGKYVLMKDAMKPSLRLYALPNETVVNIDDTFEDEESKDNLY